MSKKFHNKKIAGQLIQLALPNGIEQGFKFAYTLVVDAKICHIVTKFGCESVGQLKNHCEFEFER